MWKDQKVIAPKKLKIKENMPSSVIKHKQKLAYMNDQELADFLKDFSKEKVERLQQLHVIKNNRYMNLWNKEHTLAEIGALVSRPVVSTMNDNAKDFIDDLRHSNPIVQAEVLGILYNHNWENPHTAEEIAQEYINAPAEKRVEIDSVLKH
jgi:hypothetical protein